MPQPEWDLEKGTVTLVKGEDTKTFDINKEEDREAMMKIGQRGWHFDDEASVELGQLRKIVENWDSAIVAATKSPEGVEQLIEQLGKLGVKLTTAEKKEIKDDPKILFDEDENSALIKTIQSLEKKIENLEKSQKDFKHEADEKETKAELERLNEEALALEKKYNGKGKDGKDNGTPKFEKDKVFKYMQEKQIYEPELAFKMMNYDKLTKYEKEKAINEYKEKLNDRKNAFTEPGDSSESNIQISPKKAKSYHERGRMALKSSKEKGQSLFIEG
jgi:hypothetical protein